MISGVTEVGTRCEERFRRVQEFVGGYGYVDVYVLVVGKNNGLKYDSVREMG